MSSGAFERITIVSVSGLSDASGAALSLTWCQQQMPGARALLCSPQAPRNLPASVDWQAIQAMNYHEYSWFMLFALWRVVKTEFALIVQDDGWVLSTENWRDEFLDYDYIGAPIHLAYVQTPDDSRWVRGFQWCNDFDRPGYTITPVLNGGFSLRSYRLMRALAEHLDIRVSIPPPDLVEGDPLRMYWHNDVLLEDVQLSGVLRSALEMKGLRFAPLHIAGRFAIEHAGAVHHGMDALSIFGHHSKLRRLASIEPPTISYTISRAKASELYGELDLVKMFVRRGYRVEFAD
ncbi:DUF5672 family protein [Dyella nitratireducens]|uniref:DUF5672 domain-containing protein n=1 Tax=Dyella nitratireducens TaxID=1849580 RepID=A0ABQ1GWE1_9GAMM|nr:DUF5672 family protein [Dyella nitratireducens]GGA51255.1 hypothetical protein GCM10010981_45890 [Dyella nitratireducens]GLQ42703.1 hypothetical protein GCM10007902_25530 [Dyella nitratireducens]